MKTCAKCATENPDSSRHCVVCGATLAPRMAEQQPAESLDIKTLLHDLTEGGLGSTRREAAERLSKLTTSNTRVARAILIATRFDGDQSVRNAAERCLSTLAHQSIIEQTPRLMSLKAFLDQVGFGCPHCLSTVVWGQEHCDACDRNLIVVPGTDRLVRSVEFTAIAAVGALLSGLDGIIDAIGVAARSPHDDGPPPVVNLKLKSLSTDSGGFGEHNPIPFKILASEWRGVPRDAHTLPLLGFLQKRVPGGQQGALRWVLEKHLRERPEVITDTKLEHPEETGRAREVDEAPPPPKNKVIVADVVTVMKLITRLIVGALLGAMLVAVVGVIVWACFTYSISGVIVGLFMPAMGVLLVIDGIVATAPCIALGAFVGAAYALYRLHKSKRVRRTHSYLAGGVLLTAALALTLPLVLSWRERTAIAAQYTDFRESYNSGEYEQAYSFMSPAYRQAHSIEQFKSDFSDFNSGPAVLDLHELDANRSITFVDDKAYLLPNGTGALGPNIGPKFEFEKVEGVWYLSEAWSALELCIAEGEADSWCQR